MNNKTGLRKMFFMTGMGMIFLLTIMISNALGCEDTGVVVNSSDDCCSGIGQIYGAGQLLCVASGTTVDSNNLLNVNGQDGSLEYNPINPQTITVQDQNAGGEAQLMTEEEKRNYQFDMIDRQIGYAWIYIKLLLLVIVEFLKLIFYIVELRIVVYLLFDLIPGGFIKMRDAMVQLYLRKNST